MDLSRFITDFMGPERLRGFWGFRVGGFGWYFFFTILVYDSGKQIGKTSLQQRLEGTWQKLSGKYVHLKVNHCGYQDRKGR